MHMEGYQAYLEKFIQCLRGTQIYQENGSQDQNQEEAMLRLTELFFQIRQQRKQLFFIGNGGSAAIASHMTADFMKNGRMRTVSLYDSSMLTCMGNDYGYEYIFSRPLESLSQEGDLLVAISSSGNSLNIVNAIQTAKEKGMHVVTLSGFEKENRICRMGTYNLYVPLSHYGIVESIHNFILQQIVDTLTNYD